MKRFIIISGETLEYVQNQANDKMELGFKPIGYIQILSNGYYALQMINTRPEMI